MSPSQSPSQSPTTSSPTDPRPSATTSSPSTDPTKPPSFHPTVSLNATVYPTYSPPVISTESSYPAPTLSPTDDPTIKLVCAGYDTCSECIGATISGVSCHWLPNDTLCFDAKTASEIGKNYSGIANQSLCPNASNPDRSRSINWEVITAAVFSVAAFCVLVILYIFCRRKRYDHHGEGTEIVPLVPPIEGMKTRNESLLERAAEYGMYWRVGVCSGQMMEEFINYYVANLSRLMEAVTECSDQYECHDAECGWKQNRMYSNDVLFPHQIIHCIVYHCAEYKKQIDRAQRVIHGQSNLIRHIPISVDDATDCGDKCEILDRVLRACENVEAPESIDSDDVDHVLGKHREHSQKCPFDDCQWKQKTMITKEPQKEIHLHGHFYHGVPIDKDADDEKENEGVHIGYKSMFNDLVQSKLQLGAPIAIDDEKDAPFRNLQGEILQNGYLTDKQWYELDPICLFLSTSPKAKYMDLKKDEIMALKLYLDFPDLRQYLMRCWHEQDHEERMVYQKTFYHWNRLMESAISKSQNEITARLYIPICIDDDVMNQLTASMFTCSGPTTFYTDADSARAMGADNAIVLELYPPFGGCGMDVTWLCSYSNGPRILLSNTTLQIANIHSSFMPPLTLDQYAVNVQDLVGLENNLLIATHNIRENKEDNRLSLNKQNRIGLFANLCEKEIWSIFMVLNLQYRTELWEEIQRILSDESENEKMRFRLRAILYQRDHLINLMNGVRSVAMDDMIELLKMFFTENMSGMQHLEVDLSRILQFFPMAERVTINGDHFDWTLQNIVDLAGDHDFESEHVALRHIYLAEEQEVARDKLNEHASRENLKALRKRGWKMLTPTDLCYFGSMPEPQSPFLPMFIDQFNPPMNHQIQQLSRVRSVSRYTMLLHYQYTEDNIDDEVIRDLKLEPTETICDDTIDIEHDNFSCTLSVDTFYDLQYQQELVDLLSKRKNDLIKALQKRDAQKPAKDEFGRRCDMVESLVFDPLPMELQSIFNDKDGNLSMDIVMMMFPNVTDMYLRSTTFELADCLRFIDFFKNESNPINLQNIHFSITNRVNPDDLPKIQWRLKEIEWRFVKSRQILTKFAHPKWQCNDCGHWNRSMMIGGEYKHPQPANTECALCHFKEDVMMREDDGNLEEKEQSMENDSIFTEFQVIGKSPCRRLEYLDCEQLIHLINEYAFDAMPDKHKKKLSEHKMRILQYFRTNSINGRSYKENKKDIGIALSVECCGVEKLYGFISNGLFKAMDNVDWNKWSGDSIPGIEWIPRCAAMDRIQCILKYFEKWSNETMESENENEIPNTEFVTKLKDEYQYTLNDIQHDLEHIFNDHSNFIEMAIEDPCSEMQECIHCRRNKKFGGGADRVSESMKWFGSNDIGEVTRMMIFDRLHCVIKHYLMPKTLSDREWTFNLLLMDIRSATFPQYAHGNPMKYSSMTPKHPNLVTELIQNEMCPLSKDEVDGFIKKANSVKTNNKKVSGWKAKKSSPQNGIEEGDGMFIEFILCLLIYCHVTLYCTKFRESFRRLKFNDTEHTIRGRHLANFYWFGRYLECALKYYGKKAKKKSTFYHGLNCKFLFDDFSAVFEIPLSTSDDRQAAAKFAEGKGVIICVSPKFKKSLNEAHYLPITGTDLTPEAFRNEREFLFAGDTVLAITNLLVLGPESQDCREYVKCFLYWERILEQTVDSRPKYIYGVITGKSKDKWMERQRKYLVPLIQRKMKVYEGQQEAVDKIPQYIEQLFNYFCDRKRTVNLSCIRMEIEFMDQSLKKILFMGTDEQLAMNEYEAVDVDTLRVILPNLVNYINENSAVSLFSRKAQIN